MSAIAASASAGGPPGSCPVSGQKSNAVLSGVAAASKAKGPVFNVYSQEIDPTNMMPPPNQSLAPGQVEPLPVERVSSSIPKGGTEGTWLYPSPQMFYNSLVRKNKADGVEVKDVNMVVAIHNEMNERTWSQLKEWEADHKAFVGPAAPVSHGNHLWAAMLGLHTHQRPAL
jgi:cytochrome c heme-lyase